MKKLTWLLWWLLMCPFAWGYTGALPPGSSCPDAFCKTASCFFIEPYCDNSSQYKAYGCAVNSGNGESAAFYGGGCPNGISGPWWNWNVNTWVWLPANSTWYPGPIGCVPCDPYDSGDNGCNAGQGGQVYCKVAGQCQYQDNPCGANMQWNYKTCLCDCNYKDDLKFRFSMTSGGIQSCYEGDPLNFCDSSWLWAEIYTNPVPGYFKRDVETGNTLYRVDYSINWYLDSPCDYDCCETGWVLSHSPVPSEVVPTLNFKYRIYDWSEDGGGQLVSQTFDTTVYQKNQDAIKDDGSIYGLPSHVLLCGQSQTWQGPCPFDMYLGLVVHYHDRTQWPDCNYNSNTFQIKEVKGNDLKGSGGSLQAGGVKSGIKIKGFGGVEFHDN